MTTMGVMYGAVMEHAHTMYLMMMDGLTGYETAYK